MNMNIQTDIREYKYEYEYSSHTVLVMMTKEELAMKVFGGPLRLGTVIRHNNRQT